MMEIENEEYYKYAKDVVRGIVVAGSLIQLACQRFLDDLNDDRFEFRQDRVDRCLNFIKTLKHFKGKTSGQSFVLEPWQQFVVANLLGFYYSRTNNRRFTTAYVEIARKQGKTALAAALCLYYLIADGEDGAEVDLAANSREQANIAFDFCYQFSRQLDPHQKYLKSKLKGITFTPNASKLNVFAADASKLDGFNASFALIDEYHAALNSKVRDVLKSSQGQRQNPMLLTITTAGFDKTLPCYELRNTCIEILHKVKSDDSMFIAIYELDDDDDWTDEYVWSKAAPNLGVTVSKKYIAEQVLSAKNNASEEVGVKTKTLNMWCDSSTVWLPDSYIVKSSEPIDLQDFSEDETCYVGVDLSATSDLTAVSYLIVRDEKYYFKTDYYLPESCLKDSPNKEYYKLWRQIGDLHITSGNVVDYDYITRDICKASQIVNINKVMYDSWNATQFAINSTEQGLPLQPYSQALGNFNRPTKEMERLVLSGKVVIDDNEITRFCFRNVELKFDHNDNCKPVKKFRQKKIDGVIAMLEALGGYLETPHFSNSMTVI